MTLHRLVDLATAVIADIGCHRTQDRGGIIWFRARLIDEIEFYIAAGTGQIERDGDNTTYPCPSSW